MRSSGLAIVMALVSLPLSAEELATRASAYIEQAVEEHRLPALSAGILIDGEIAWTGTAGFADVESGTPATPGTTFRIASISKVLTTVAVLRMAEQGTLDLDATLQQYLPDFPAPRKGK